MGSRARALNLNDRKKLIAARTLSRGLVSDGGDNYVDGLGAEALHVDKHENYATRGSNIDLLDLVQRWRAQRPFENDDVFSRRLEASDLTFEGFIDVLSLEPTPAELAGASDNDTGRRLFSVNPETKRRTQDDLVNASSDSRASRDNHALHGNIVGHIPQEHVRETGGYDEKWRELLARIPPANAEHLEVFPALVGPELAAAYARIDQYSVAAGAQSHLNRREFVDDAFSFLLGKVARMAQRALLQELERKREHKELDGTTPRARFDHFCALLGEPDYRNTLLEAYPVLLRLLLEAIAQWERFVSELLDAYVRDEAAIFEMFFSGEAKQLASIVLEAGDDHHGGRSVSILKFSTGEKLVYRPQSLSIYCAFAGFIDWVNAQDLKKDLKLPQVLAQDGYGWVEYIEQKPCADAGEVKDFFYRQGAYLGLLYLFNASDFHHENIIAAGAFPMLVDLETLIQPDLSLLGFLGDHAPPGNEVFRSVLGPGLLPQQIWKTGDARDGVDIGGLTAGDQLSSVALLVIADPGTDRMRLIREKTPIPPGNHLATLQGAPVDASDFLADLLDGFHDAYDMLAKNREFLLSKRGPLSVFDDAQVRIILRPTFYYGLQLSDAFHPRMLGNALERDLYFDRLWVDVVRYPVLANVAEAERAAYWRNDIPAFSTLVGERSLTACNGETFDDFFPVSARETMAEKLENFGPADRLRQSWLIEKSLSVRAANAGAGGFEDYPIDAAPSVCPPQDYLNAARDVAEYLARLSFRGGGGASWFTCVPGESVHWVYRDAGEDLYSGLPGMALFFAYLAKTSGEGAYRDIAEAAWRNTVFILRGGRRQVDGIGAFTGWGSLLYTAHHLSSLWDDPSTVSDIMELLPPAETLARDDRIYDVVGGAAGFLLSALNLIDSGDPDLRDHALACGDHLLTNVVETETGAGWLLDVAGPKPLGGFSHGAAGIALALRRLGKAFGDQRFSAVGEKALAYDRSLFAPREGNWRDVREGLRPGETEAQSENFVVAWCHGAPGIGLSRALMKRQGLAPSGGDVDEEILTAAATTRTEGFGRNHSLCHGDFGNLDCMRVMAAALDNQDLSDAVDRIAAGVLKSIGKVGWRTGFAPQVQPLGMMSGVAGIGYGLLRCAVPETPSILALEPPR